MKNKYQFQVNLFWIVFAFFCSSKIVAQGVNLGIPPIHNFSKYIYKAGTQNWDAAQDSRGVLFFANNEGLLQFDGTHWHCHPVSNKTVVRSVTIDPKGQIFVGAQSEMGYFFPDNNGQLQYHSLIHLLPPEKRNFEDVWDIVSVGEAVFFRTNRTVFQFENQKITIHEPGGELTAMFSTPRGLVIQQNLTDLLIFEAGGFRPFIKYLDLRSSITGAIPWKNDTILFSSLKNGLFYFAGNQLGRWKTNHDNTFKEKRIYTATALPNGQIALGSSLGGLLVIDENRRVYRHMTTKHGLQNNNILSTFSDQMGNLWLGLDSGIDCVVLDSPFSTIIPDDDLQGTGYAAMVFQNQLYLGVSNGVYHTNWNAFYEIEQGAPFKKIKPTDGQVWTLDTVGGQLLLGHHEGSFAIDGTTLLPMSAEPGAWTFVQASDQYLLGGTYTGIVLYEKKGQTWQFIKHLDGLQESCRFMVKDSDGALWVSHPYRGLYRIEWSEARKSLLNVQFFNAKNGLPSDLNNLVFKVAGKAIFATENGIFRYDKGKSVFVPDEEFNQMLGKKTRINYIKEDLKGNIWYVSEKEVGLLKVEDLGLKKTVQKRIYPEISEKLVSGFEFIFPIDESNVFFGAEQGFIHFDATGHKALDTILHLVLSHVGVSGTQDSTLFHGWFLGDGGLQAQQSANNIPVLESGSNNLSFLFSATDYKNPAYLTYRFKLEGLNREWSNWSGENFQNFTNLSPGKYSFLVQAQRKDGIQSEVLSFVFKIRSPWYANNLAFVLYALGFLGLFLSFLLRQHRKFESEKENLTLTHLQKAAAQQREVEQSKAAITVILKEKLEADIRFKNQELASATMHLVQKGEILQTIQENLNLLLKKSPSQALKKEIQQLLNLLNFDAQLDDDWQHFAFHFDHVYVDFLKRLREKHPQLSANDHKLCAYLRMNLTTKEIAPLMNISVRGVEASRYRLRKKLGLLNDANLTEVILDL